MAKLNLFIKTKLSRGDIETRFKMISFIEDYPAELQFQIAVPHDWGVVPIQPKPADLQTPITIIGKLKPKTSDKADISIWNAFLAREMHPSDWLESWIKTQGYTVHDSRSFTTSFGLVSDIVATKIIEKSPYICRLTAIKDAGRIFLLIARVKSQYASEFNAYQEVFLMSLQTLKLLNPTKQKFAEAFNWTTFQQPNILRFLTPYSWESKEIKDAPYDGEGKVFKNKLEDVVLGSIFVLSSSKILNCDRIEETLVAKIKNNNFFMVENSCTKVSEQTLASDAKLTINHQRLNKEEKEYVLIGAHYDAKELNMVLMLLSPHKNTHFDSWAINRRAFEILINSIELQAI